MSFGFYRKPSPAQRKARRLKNLRIEEVSSVDVGAGHGVHVALVKRDEYEERETIMEKMQGARGEAGAYSIAKRAWEAAQEGRLSEFDLNTVIRECARVYHDGDLNKLFQSELGKIFLQPRTMRKSVAEEAALLAKRAGDTPHSRLAQHGDQTGTSLNGGSERARAERAAKLIKYFQDQGDSYDVAATKAYRAEKAESDMGSHEGENRRPRRGMTGARVNGNDGLGEEDSR
jgi:hypothetical protein